MPSIQEAMEKAFEVAEAERSSAAPAQPQEQTNEPEAREPEVKEPAAETPGEAARARGPDGKFLPKGNEVPSDPKPEAKEPVAGAPAPAAAPAAGPAPAPQASRGPVSWRPEVREKFGALPAEVQQEVVRREREVEQALRSSAESRRMHDEFTRAMAPYEAMIRAENATPMQAVQSVMNTAYQLRVAPPMQKAQLVAQMIANFGVDIGMLDEILSGAVQGNAPRTPQNDPTLQFIQQQLAPVQQFMQRFQQMETTAQTRTQEQVAQEIQQFQANPEVAEFWEDLSGDVADLLELSARQGHKMSLQDAWQRATMLHPTISKILADRKVAASAQQQSQRAQAARNASASIPSGGAPEQGEKPRPKPGDHASAIEQAWALVEGRNAS
jgi:hypothetical protein